MLVSQCLGASTFYDTGLLQKVVPFITKLNIDLVQNLKAEVEDRDTIAAGQVRDL